MVNFYNKEIENIPGRSEDPIRYDTIVEFFEKKGIKGLNNGLNEEDNERLFTTIHVPEMISLVLHGLSNLRERNPFI